jgi:hypothetical protein
LASGESSVSPSQNPQLNAITPSGKIEPEKKGFLQKSYETWEKEEWEPNTQADRETETAEKPEPATDTAPEPVKDVTVPESKTETETPETSKEAEEVNASKTFKLQYYIDKWGRYLDEKEKQKSGPSHTEELEQMPVIGK